MRVICVEGGGQARHNVDGLVVIVRWCACVSAEAYLDINTDVLQVVVDFLPI